MIFRWLCLLFLLTAVRTAAGDDLPRLRLGGSGELTHLGISIRPFEGMTKVPVPVPATGLLKAPDGQQIPVVHRRDFWLNQQLTAMFRGSGCTIQVYRPASPPPNGVKTLHQDFLREDDLRAWLAAAPEPDFHDPAARRQWLEAAFGAGTYPEGDSFTLLRQNAQAKLFLLNRPPAADEAWGIVLIAFPGSWDGDVYEKPLESLAGSIRFTVPPENTSRRVRARARTAAVRDQRSPAYEASRQRVIDSLKSMKDWWYIESDHFIVVSNISRRKDVRQIADEAEDIRRLYEKLMPPPAEIEAISVIRIFDDREQYNAYIGSGAEWTGGCWMAHKQELVFFIPYDDIRDKKIRSEIMKRTLYHELLHQYFFYALGQNTAPPWFNEGLAQYYEYVSFKSRNNPSFRTDMEIDARVLPTLGTGFSNVSFIRGMDYPVFQQFHQATYGAVFGMMYYLMKGAAQDDATRHYCRIPVRYFNTLGQTRDMKKADQTAWEGIDLERFNHDYQAFWRSRERRKTHNDDTLPAFTDPQFQPSE